MVLVVGSLSDQPFQYVGNSQEAINNAQTLSDNG